MNQRTNEDILFQAAIGLDPASRASYLDRECRGDPVLRSRLDLLLAAHDQSDTREILDDGEFRPSIESVLRGEVTADEAMGRSIGRYKVLERLGEGGCGVVYVAEQSEPVRRRVALKLIKPGMDSKAVIARFEAERQALAMMEHPNIARVLDAGTTDTGRPFFVMELVRGLRITDHCDREQLPMRVRLDLFVQVCQAIQHAHQKGVIHRDIKPSNILVTMHDGVPVPKVIDFGIAKAIEGRLVDATVYTRLHHFLGTPAYMSPEQAEMSGLDIDTRCDIYSLGVLLYELLTGATPFDGKALVSQGLDFMLRTIRETEPIRPSTRLRQERGGASPSGSVSLSRSASVPSDLDWIVMKCLEKDRSRRYETANGLAMDLKRHLANEPVVARPPSLGYRLAKALRRHWLASAATGAVLAALVAGMVIAAAGLRQAVHQRNLALAAQSAESRQRDEAQRQRERAEEERERAKGSEEMAHRLAYASDINLAQRALAENNLGRTRALLDRHRPGAGQADRRGWEWRYLWQQCRSEASSVLPPSSNLIGSLAASRDGRWLAVGSHHGGMLSLRDARSGLEILRHPAGEDGVLAAFSPREPLLAYSLVTGLASARPLGRLRFWNPSTGEAVGDLPLEGVCRSLGFSNDGSKVVAATFGEHGNISLWRLPDLGLLARVPIQAVGHDAGTPFALDAEARLAAHLVPDGGIAVIELPEGNHRWVRKTEADRVQALAFSRDGRLLASGAGILEGHIQIWDARTGEGLVRLPGHRLWVSTLLFLPDGRTLISASADQQICLWDLSRLDQVPPPRVFRGHLHEIWRLALLADDRTLVSGSKDGSLLVWDTSSTGLPASHFTLPGSFRSWHFSPSAGGAVVWDAQGNMTERAGRRLEVQRPIGRIPIDTHVECFSDDGRRFAVVSPDGRLQAWQLSPQFTAIGDFPIPPGAEPLGFIDAGRSLVLNLPAEGRVRICRVETGRVELEWPGIVGRSKAAFSSIPRRCLQIGYNGSALLTDLPTLHQRPWQLALPYVQDVAISPDGRYGSSVSDYGLCRLLRMDDLSEAGAFRSVILGMHSVGFSPVEARFAVGGNGGEAVQLVDLDSGQPLLSLTAEGTMFHDTAFSPDGELLGSLNQRGILHFWRAPSWAEINAAEKDGPSPHGRDGPLQALP